MGKRKRKAIQADLGESNIFIVRARPTLNFGQSK